MRISIARLTVIAVLSIPGSASAWGFDGHRFIMARAIPLLPVELRPFFTKYHEAIVEHAIDPDLWRTAGWEAEESPRHFLDMDAYGPYPFNALPREYDKAVTRYGREFVERNGTLPWRTEEMYRKLVEAFTQKSPWSRENVKFFASVIAHYVADAHVPFHASINYDGQLTGQWGIHARFETELFDRYRDKLLVTPRAPVPIRNPREFIFETLTASFPLVQPILDADKEAVAGRDVYDDDYFNILFGKVRPILERRLADSIAGVAAVITAAWIEAGRPAVPADQIVPPRKVRRQ